MKMKLVSIILIKISQNQDTQYMFDSYEQCILNQRNIKEYKVERELPGKRKG